MASGETINSILNHSGFSNWIDKNVSTPIVKAGGWVADNVPSGADPLLGTKLFGQIKTTMNVYRAVEPVAISPQAQELFDKTFAIDRYPQTNEESVDVNLDGEDEAEGVDDTEGEDDPEGEDGPEGVDNTVGEEAPVSDDVPDGEEPPENSESPEGGDNLKGEETPAANKPPESEESPVEKTDLDVSIEKESAIAEKSAADFEAFENGEKNQFSPGEGPYKQEEPPPPEPPPPPESSLKIM